MTTAPFCQGCRHHHHDYEACPICGHMPRAARFREAQTLPKLFKLLFSTFDSPCLAQPRALSLLRQASILRQKVFCRNLGWREDLGSGHEEDQFDTVSLHILATVGDVPVAYGRYRLVSAPGPDGPAAAVVSLPTIDRLVVHPQYRGRGFGFVLLYKLIQDMLARMATAGAPSFPAVRVLLPISGSGLEAVHAWFARQGFVRTGPLHAVDPTGFIQAEQYVNERTGAQNGHVCEYHFPLHDPGLPARVADVVGVCIHGLIPTIQGAVVVPGSGLGVKGSGHVPAQAQGEGMHQDGCTAYMRLLLYGDPPRPAASVSSAGGMVDGDEEEQEEGGAGGESAGAGAAAGRARREEMYSAQEAQAHYDELIKIRTEETAEKAAIHKAYRDQRQAALRAHYAAEAERREQEAMAKRMAEGFGQRSWSRSRRDDMY